MRILVVGRGGREHALIWKLKQSPRVSQIYAAPGNAGISKLATCVDIEEKDIASLVQFAKKKQIDLTVVGPEEPLLMGLVDQFQEHDLPVYGPTQAAARIEGSKRFAKALMEKYQIPTARYQAFDQADEAIAYVRKKGAPIVVKADGLAAGKGVILAETLEQAEAAINRCMKERAFGDAGREVVIEEYLYGQEISLMAFVDGKVVRPMVIAQDHKPVFDGDEGPNTGGMGAYSPVPQIEEEMIQRGIEEILIPMANALVEEGIHYQGVLYAGLMITSEGPKVIEFNARFGDPETQVVLPRLKSDLLDILLATLEGELSKVEIHWKHEAAVCVVMASEGYPRAYQTGFPITGLPEATESVIPFHAGTRHEGETVVTNGGRVLGITGLGKDLIEARAITYEAIDKIMFSGAHYRKDIASKALDHVKV